MVNPLRQIDPELLEVFREAAEKRRQREAMTIRTGGVQPPDTQNIIDSVMHGKPMWRTIAQAAADEHAEKARLAREAHELVFPEDVVLPTRDEAGYTGI